MEKRIPQTIVSERLLRLPPYLFVDIDRKKRAAMAAGRDIIDFGVGDPDRPTFPFVVERMSAALKEPANHRYALGIGSPEFRDKVAAFFAMRFGVTLEPKTEVLALIGSKEGLGHLPLAVVNPGEVVLVPDPGYPVYTSATIFAGGDCHKMPLTESNRWLPNFDSIPLDVRRRAKLMFLNYPNNPTAACAPRSFFEDAVRFARDHQILVAQDAAYSEVFFDDPPPSILQIEGAKDCCVELHSLSKTFNMTGWRVAFAVGNREILAALAKVKNNIDSGVFGAIQEAGMEALRKVESSEVLEQREIYRRRRDILVNGLRQAGWSVALPAATFYVWAACPKSVGSMDASGRILDECDVVVIPGVGFGSGGEGFVRFALTVNEDRTRQAVERLRKLRW